MASLQCDNCVIHTWRLRGEILTMGRYTNPASFTFLNIKVPNQTAIDNATI